jgi:polar amino acid transport system permease protein
VDLYLDAKLWVADAVCAALQPISPALFATSCGRFLDGFFVTIELLAVSTLLGFPLALMLAIARTSNSTVLSGLSYAYSYVFRGTPLLVQLWVFYYGFGALGAEGLGPFWPLFRDAYSVGLLTLTVNTAAYAAEIFRGGIVNVASG